ncbi:MAG: MBL fold metallo-hydrolase, partial [Chloroflexi bacterium]|nr:MBL fold metallo-hydrolase [Chloroflexota bacterium]
SETRQVIEYIERRAPVKYVIYTHYHADHTYGGYLFRNAQFIAHELCRELLITRGDAGLKLARVQNSSLADVQLRLPDIVFSGEMTLRLGGKTFVLTHSPGHTPDGITVYIREDKILFAADTVMPVPYVVDGDAPTMLKSLQTLKGMALENVVQGHGEIVLRGEINETINSSINYLNKMQNAVVSALTANQSRDDMLREYDIESCGKTRIALNGLVQQLHAANLIATYDRLSTDKSKLAAAKARSAAAALEEPAGKPKAKAKSTKKPIKAKTKATRKPIGAKARPAKKAAKTNAKAATPSKKSSTKKPSRQKRRK